MYRCEIPFVVTEPSEKIFVLMAFKEVFVKVLLQIRPVETETEAFVK